MADRTDQEIRSLIISNSVGQYLSTYSFRYFVIYIINSINKKFKIKGSRRNKYYFFNIKTPKSVINIKYFFLNLLFPLPYFHFPRFASLLYYILIFIDISFYLIKK